MAQRLDFYDVKKKKKISTTSYTKPKIINTPSGPRKMVSTLSKDGRTLTRFVSDTFKKK